MRQAVFRLAAMLMLTAHCIALLPSMLHAELRLGVFPRRNARVMKTLFQPLAEALAEELGEPVTLVLSPDLDSFRRRCENGELDIMRMPQTMYVMLRETGHYRLLCASAEFGADTLRGALVVRKDSGIGTIEDLRGKTLIFRRGQLSSAGFVAPMYMLRQAGMLPGRDFQVRYAKTGPGAVIAVYYRQADAAGAGNVVLKLKSTLRKVDVQQLTIIAQSVPFPQLPWVASTSLDAEKIRRIRTWMLGLAATREGKELLRKVELDGFVPVEDSAYDIIESMLSALK